MTGVAALFLQQVPSASAAEVGIAIRDAASRPSLTGIGAGSPDLLLNSGVPVSPLARVTGPTAVRGDEYCTWTVSVSGGARPYRFVWSGVLSGSATASASPIGISGTVTSAGQLFVDVWDSQGRYTQTRMYIGMSSTANNSCVV